MATVKLLGQKGCHVGLAQSNNIGEKDTAILIEHLACVVNRLFLIFQLPETNRDVYVLQF